QRITIRAVQIASRAVRIAIRAVQIAIRAVQIPSRAVQIAIRAAVLSGFRTLFGRNFSNRGRWRRNAGPLGVDIGPR
ncbi:MAG: hypothetical protein AAB288_05320, partial [Acidobacteriota bacterium]